MRGPSAAPGKRKGDGRGRGRGRGINAHTCVWTCSSIAICCSLEKQPQTVDGAMKIAMHNTCMYLFAVGGVIEVILGVGVGHAGRVPTHNVEGGSSVEPGLAVPLDLRRQRTLPAQP